MDVIFLLMSLDLIVLTKHIILCRWNTDNKNNCKLSFFRVGTPRMDLVEHPVTTTAVSVMAPPMALSASDRCHGVALRHSCEGGQGPHRASLFPIMPHLAMASVPDPCRLPPHPPVLRPPATAECSQRLARSRLCPTPVVGTDPFP